MKRYRTPTAKPGELLIKYGQEHGERDLYFCYGGDGATRRDTSFLYWLFNQELEKGIKVREELESRGYDITTLKFSIMQNK
jgi:hypothetical protein